MSFDGMRVYELGHSSQVRVENSGSGAEYQVPTVEVELPLGKPILIQIKGPQRVEGRNLVGTAVEDSNGPVTIYCANGAGFQGGEVQLSIIANRMGVNFIGSGEVVIGEGGLVSLRTGDVAPNALLDRDNRQWRTMAPGELLAISHERMFNKGIGVAMCRPLSGEIKTTRGPIANEYHMLIVQSGTSLRIEPLSREAISRIRS